MRCVTQDDDAGRVPVDAQQLQLRLVVLDARDRVAAIDVEFRAIEVTAPVSAPRTCVTSLVTLDNSVPVGC